VRAARRVVWREPLVQARGVHGEAAAPQGIGGMLLSKFFAGWKYYLIHSSTMYYIVVLCYRMSLWLSCGEEGPSVELACSLQICMACLKQPPGHVGPAVEQHLHGL
jgi:hypothetical protein